MGLSIQMVRRLSRNGTDEKTGTQRQSSYNAPLWHIVLLYVLVPATIVLILYAWNTAQTGTLAIGTYVGGLLLIFFIFIRQIIAMQETRRLNRGLKLARQALHEKNDALETANMRLETLATTDPLTELPNHRSLLATLSNELERAQRYQRCTLFFLDLDHFKALNDGYGHAAGDEVLIALGQRLCQNVRDIDVVGRWGGEEFIVILPEVEGAMAIEIAERVRVAVSQEAFAMSGGLHLTCSIGIASYPTHATTVDVLINAADQAMYMAKRLGRNQYRVIDDPAIRFLLSCGASEENREEVALNGFVLALTSLMKQHDTSLGNHAKAVADLVEQLVMKAGISSHEASMAHLAGLLHDIGKIGIPDAILQKPGRLTPDEWKIMKRHSEIGAEIVMCIPALRPLATAIRGHHERWDGTGHPDQLCGENIPPIARVIAVVDAYMAMLVDRPYQKARPSEDALKELRRCSGTQFDPTIVEALAILLQEQVYPDKVAVHAPYRGLSNS